MGIVDDLMGLPPDLRMRWYADLTLDQRGRVLNEFATVTGSRWGMWVDDPVGFVEGVLGDFLWSRQKDLLNGIRDHARLAVPASKGPGKSWCVGRAVVWWVAVHPPGSAVAVTTAYTWKQVRAVLWPHIRRVHKEHNFPGSCNQTEWAIGPDIVAFGISPKDEIGAQGIHARNCLVVIDEAGGMNPALAGALSGLVTTEHSRMVATGNPPIDEGTSWFEGVCSSPEWMVLPISTFDTPNFTDEKHDCPRHILEELPSRRWVDNLAAEHPKDSAYWISTVLGAFPKSASNKAIPAEWIANCAPREAEGLTRDEDGTGGWQRLGVDVASDGGDEFVIAHMNGQRIAVVHTSVAADNSNQVDVAGQVLGWIHHCQALQERSGYDARKVRVKIDAIGIGRGTADILSTWKREGLHDADIVYVNSAERAVDASRFHNKRAEAWWNMRELVRETDVVLAIDEKEGAQLNGPKWKEDSAGRTLIEKKSDMAKRGLTSPDRADAIIYAAYEPESVEPPSVSTPTAAAGGRTIPRAPRDRWA